MVHSGNIGGERMTGERRPFGFWTATALVMGGMIGSGIFLLPSSLAPFGWFGLLAWVISVSGSLAIAYALSRLAAEMPHATGAVAVTGAVLGPLPGVLVGWTYWVSVWGANAAISIAATSYLSVFFPALSATPLVGALTSIALIWLLTLLNLGGARLAGQFQVVTTVLKLLPLIAVIAIAAMLMVGGVTPITHFAAQPSGFGSITSAVTLTLFALIGFEAAGIAAERVRDPERNVMRATMVGTALTGGLYVLVCLSVILFLPVDALGHAAAPFALFVETYVGHGPALAVALFAAIAAIGALNGWVLIQGEVPLGMARAGLLPAWFARVNARDVPVRVLLLSSTLASLLVYFNSSKTLGGVFQFVALLTASSNLWFYAAVCVAALVRRVAIVPAGLGLAFSIWALIGAGVGPSLLSLALMLTAIPAYFLRSRVPAQQPA